ncbi:MAG: hypothetical protein RLZZ172_1193 [Bacteroidota bacterium]|jgi:nucleoside-diphosphate-sugar epimerase
MKDKILVTGKSGFIGQSLSDYFSQADLFSTVAYDRSVDFSQVKKDDYSAIVHLAGLAHDLVNKNDWDVYYNANTVFTKKLFEAYLESNIEVFIFVSTVKAVVDSCEEVLTEFIQPNPLSSYGKSKFLAESSILELGWKEGAKRVYILRPSMVHGPGNKGNLNLLYNFCKHFSFWPLGTFNNKRSFCSVSNLCFVINEMIQRKDIPSGVYNVADDEPISTNLIIQQMAEKFNKKIHLLNIPKPFFSVGLKLASLLGMDSIKVKFQKLTENFIVSNSKLKLALGKEFPVSANEGLKKTIESFN